VVFRAVVFKLLVWCGAEGYVSGLHDAAKAVKWLFLLFIGRLLISIVGSKIVNKFLITLSLFY
jgi:hypothetical protein